MGSSVQDTNTPTRQHDQIKDTCRPPRVHQDDHRSHCCSQEPHRLLQGSHLEVHLCQLQGGERQPRCQRPYLPEEDGCFWCPQDGQGFWQGCWVLQSCQG